MARQLAVFAVALLMGCASTYNLPEAQRSRVYDVPAGAVWNAAIDAVADAGLAVIETEPEHGRIRARKGGSIYDLEGHVLFVVIGELDDGRVRVDANVENASTDDPIDFGQSKRILRAYLAALDARTG